MNGTASPTAQSWASAVASDTATVAVADVGQRAVGDAEVEHLRRAGRGSAIDSSLVPPSTLATALAEPDRGADLGQVGDLGGQLRG